jgi:hypothetical protein
MKTRASVLIRLLVGAALLGTVTTAHGDKPASSLTSKWHGSWSGKMVSTDADDKSSEVALVLKIEPIKESNELNWTMTYGDGDKAIVKDYKLVPVKDQPGRFLLDEKNGAAFDARLVNEELFTQVEVGGAIVSARYELVGDTLRYEVFSSKPAKEKTGNGNVQGYVVEVVQKANLKKS